MDFTENFQITTLVAPQGLKNSILDEIWHALSIQSESLAFVYK